MIKNKNVIVLKSLTSAVLAFIMLLGILPFGEIKANADSSVIACGNAPTVGTAFDLEYDQFYSKSYYKNENFCVKLVLPKDGYVSISGTSSYHLKCQFVDSNERVIGSSTTSDMHFTYGLKKGTYYLKTKSEGYSSNSLLFEAYFVAVNTVEIEPNETCTTATNLDYGKKYIGFINDYSDKDYYKVKMTKNASVSFVFDDYEEAEPVIYLYGPDRTLRDVCTFKYDYSAGEYHYDYCPTETGYYYLEISALKENDPYNISVYKLPVGWQKMNGKWYYIVPEDFGDQMAINWWKLGGKWYYFGSDGVMRTGWNKISGKWYYFNKSGAMQTGWQKISNKWYYFNSGGAMQTGWVKSGGKWYYMQSSGAMKTGWLKSGGEWYYLDSSGVMLASTSRRIGSKTYRFNSSGVCLNP